MRLTSLLIATTLALSAPVASHAKDNLEPAVIMQTADTKVGLNGLVCDFCSIALNKTFKKNEAVAATHVDLDTKELSIVFKDGQSLDDETITKLVKKAGYSVTEITHKADLKVETKVE